METVIEQETALILVERLTPKQLFAPGALDPIVERIKREVRAVETDMSTEAGRKAIASLAMKVSRSKTFIEAQRVILVGEEKKRLAAIDAEGRRVREELDALRDEVLKPLTDYREAEKARADDNETRIAVMNTLAATTFTSIDQIQTAHAGLVKQYDHDFQLWEKRAGVAYEKACAHLQAEEKRIRQEDADRAERDRRRIEAEEKARIERENKIADEAKAKADAEAKRREEAQAEAARQREAELTRTAAEEKARLEREKQENEERLLREKEASEARLKKSLEDAKAKAKRAEEERAEAERKAEADKVAERERAEAERERAVAEERRRQEDIRLKQEEERAALEKERARREADKAHRQKVHAAAFEALVAQVPNLTTDAARAVVNAIKNSLIPGISITY